MIDTSFWWLKRVFPYVGEPYWSWTFPPHLLSFDCRLTGFCVTTDRFGANFDWKRILLSQWYSYYVQFLCAFIFATGCIFAMICCKCICCHCSCFLGFTFLKVSCFVWKVSLVLTDAATILRQKRLNPWICTPAYYCCTPKLARIRTHFFSFLGAFWRTFAVTVRL